MFEQLLFDQAHTSSVHRHESTHKKESKRRPSHSTLNSVDITTSKFFKVKPSKKKTISPAQHKLFLKKQNMARMTRASYLEKTRQMALELANGINAHSQRQRLERELFQKAVEQAVHLMEDSQAVRAKVKVVIVGAGLAGLSAAHQLCLCGFKHVVVLEALPRLGGRVHTAVMDDGQGHQVVELGCPGITSVSSDNSVYHLARTMDLLEGSTRIRRREKGVLIRHATSEAPIFFPDLQPFTRLVAKETDLLYTNIHSERQARPNLCLTQGDYLRERRRRLVTSFGGSNLGEQKDVNRMVGGLLRCDCQLQTGDDAGEAAAHLLGMRKGEEMDNEFLQVVVRILKGGMKRIIRSLSSRLPKNTVRCRAAVTSIDWSAFNVKNAREGVRSEVKVTCKDGRVFFGDHVLVTVPVGHLKKHSRTLFTPGLPETHLAAIDRIGIGTVTKVIFFYADPFWDDEVNFTFCGEACNSSRLTANSMNFRTQKTQPGVLEVSMLGSVVETMSDDEVAKQLTGILKQKYKKELPLPTRVRKSKWKTCPFFGGSHPYLTCDTQDVDLQVLSTPLSFRERPVVLFAGDYTNVHFRCLAHAARESGKREAQRIMDLYDFLFGYRNRAA